LWYSNALFGKAWMKENKLTDEDLRNANPAKKFGLSFVFSLVMAFNLAAFLGDDKTDMAWGAMAGALAGIGWVAMSIGIVGLFENKSWRYIFINAGYNIVAFIVMGVIIGAWR
jgi:hypothetical protein